ncbi:hypothetical protein ACLOJK_025943 [Asimina triloba]
MRLLSALAIASLTTASLAVESGELTFGSLWWFIYAGGSCILVLFAGIMSGLTLGLMSLGLVELEILRRSGTSAEKKQAGPFHLHVFDLYCVSCRGDWDLRSGSVGGSVDDARALELVCSKVEHLWLDLGRRDYSIDVVSAFVESSDVGLACEGADGGCNNLGSRGSLNFFSSYLEHPDSLLWVPQCDIVRFGAAQLMLHGFKMRHTIAKMDNITLWDPGEVIWMYQLSALHAFYACFSSFHDFWVDVLFIAFAAAILPVVQKQHQLLVTLLLCNAVAMEALPICLDKIFHPAVAIILSVSFVLVFGEVLPQAICTRYGLAVGANFVWLVRILMIVCYPIAYPIGKLLDCLLGHNESALFRRAQLKALVSIHGQEAGKGGELTHDETTIISGALDLTAKTAEEAMTPIESTFSLDVNSKLDWEAIGKILARGHSRVPVYSGNPKNIIGLLLVKSLLTVRAETETPVSAVSIRRIPRVPSDMPLYDILNEFQKGSSHMAAVVKAKGKTKNPKPSGDGEKSEEKKGSGDSARTSPLLPVEDQKPESIVVDVENGINKKVNISKLSPLPQNDATTNVLSNLSEDIEDGEVIGIITLEDVFEELLQEEIVDETDEYVDVHKRIRVAAAAAASSVARAPSIRRLTAHKGGQSRQGQPGTTTPKKHVDEDSNSVRIHGSLAEPLLGNAKR